MATKKTGAPWDRPNPKARSGKPTHHLSPAQKATAKSAAKKAGRPYPNLVDNMHAAAKKTSATKTTAAKAPAKKAAAKSAAKKATPKKTAAKKTAAKKAPAKKAASKKAVAKKAAAKKAPAKKAASKKAPAKKATDGKAAEKDPEGGLTAAGRAAFHDKQGSNLKPGVMKAESEMTPEEMKRKGSWAARFYGRDPLPPLVDKKGKPTRLALSAHAWGEKVPKTEAEAREIAAKGRALLERYRSKQAG